MKIGVDLQVFPFRLAAVEIAGPEHQQCDVDLFELDRLVTLHKAIVEATGLDFGVLDRLEGEEDIIRIKGIAIRPFDILSQIKCPSQPVLGGFPLFRQVGEQLVAASAVVADQRLGHRLGPGRYHAQEDQRTYDE